MANFDGSSRVPPPDRPVLVAVDIHARSFPVVECVMPPGTDPAIVVRTLSERVMGVFSELLPGAEWPLGRLELECNPRSGPLLTPEECKLAFETLRETLRAGIIAEPAVPKERKPDATGYWSVSGLRHSCAVWATGETDAISKAAEIVQDWESPEATFLGERPDVIV